MAAPHTKANGRRASRIALLLTALIGGLILLLVRKFLADGHYL